MPFFCWDVSTSVIGVCLLQDHGEAVAFTHLEPGRFETMSEKYEYVARSVRELIDRWSEIWPGEMHHFIEDRLGNFSAGATTLQTLMKLAAMNAAVTCCIINHGVPDPSRVTHIHPATAKKWAGLKVPKGENKKAHAVRFARAYSDVFPYAETPKGNPKKGVEDMADALVTGVAGFKMRNAGALKAGKAETASKVPRGPKDRKARKGRVRLPVPRL